MRLHFTKKQVWCGALTILSSFYTPQLVKAAEIEPKVNGTSQICKGGSAMLSATIKEGNEYASFQWQISSDNIHFTDIEGAKSKELISSELHQTTYFRVKVLGGETGLEEVSGTLTVSVVPRPNLDVKVDESTQKMTFQATLTGGIDCKIQWQRSDDKGQTWNDIDNAQGSTFTPPVVTTEINYRAKALCSGLGCCN